MEVGLNLPVMVPGLDRDMILDWSRRIDAGPFSSLAAGERINFPNPEIMVTLSAAAAVTTRVRIAATVIVLPMHRPAMMAKQIATLDVISGGRVSLGVGVGARVDDFQAAESPFDRRRMRRMESSVDLMRRAWRGEIVVPGATRPIEPFPMQPNGPEILVGALAGDSITRAARYADGICGFSFGPSKMEVDFAFQTARQAWKDCGRGKAPRLVTSCWFNLRKNARSEIETYLGRYLAFLGEGVPEQMAPKVKCDSAANLRETMRQLADIGTDELILVPTTSDADEVNRLADLVG